MLSGAAPPHQPPLLVSQVYVNEVSFLNFHINSNIIYLGEKEEAEMMSSHFPA